MRINRRNFIELTAAGAATAALPAFAADQSAGAMPVTGDSVDPRYTEPYIEVNEMRSSPEPHHYVHGGFKGTPDRFSFYFPAKERYHGRFYHNTYPLITDSDAGPSPIDFKINEGNIGFAFESGGYYVQTNQGGSFAARGDKDPSISSGYRLNAAAAKYSRVVAAQIYGPGPRPFGYLHGGSGGAYQTMGCAQCTSGVWDGFLPYVLGSPYTNMCRPYAQYVLGKRNKFPGIVDALDPGGSGDPYAGLNEEEHAALLEVTRMGFPLTGWFLYDNYTAGGGGGRGDPTYVEDFWSKPGYLGTDPKSSMRKWRIQFETTVGKVSAGPPATIELSDVADGDMTGAQLMILSGAAAGKNVSMAKLKGKTITLGGGGGGGFGGGGIAGLGGGGGGGLPAGLQAGDKVRIDNSAFLAGLCYHRYTLPASAEYYSYNQFRGPDGKPLYPQRHIDLTPTAPISSTGALANGQINGKVLAVQGQMDVIACPWNADWYKTKVRKTMGAKFDENFALWFADHAQHDVPGHFGTVGYEKRAWARTISAVGIIQQGLRDLTIWVEKGVKPSQTNYKMVDSQVVTSTSARERGGIQPMVALQANGGVRTNAAMGKPVKFTATIEVPPGMGKVVAVEWDYEGNGEPQKSETLATPASPAHVSSEHAYSKPGTYFAVLRAFSQRQGDSKTPYARVQNIARVRVVVS